MAPRSTKLAGLLAIVGLITTAACLLPDYGGLYQTAGLPDSVAVDRLVVHKGERILEAWSGDTLVRTYVISVGRGGAGPKRFEGDQRTPEGHYRIDSRHRSAEFGFFLHISYPNDEDRAHYAAGLRDGTIPPGRGIGGDIGLHGEKAGWGWLPHTLFGTAGCVMVDDDAARELYERVAQDAEIDILP
jgi:murein L,D-transpeptidase YafK